ncbi:unnamed protein product [Gordionus sp. m RMFG-2023]
MSMISITLNSGYSMPILGLCTYLADNKATIFKLIETALMEGYRAFGTL